MANISQVQLPSGVSYPIKAPVIPYGMVDSTSTSTAFTATVPGITELTNGTIMMLHNGVVTSESGFTVNINGLGAKKCYNNMTNATRDTTIFNVAYTMIFVYASDLDEGNGGWWIYRGYDGNTNTIGYQLRTNSGDKVAIEKGYRYRLWFTSADGSKWVPANTSTATNATTNRSLNTRPIDPFGPIVYRSGNSTTDGNTGLGATGIWQQYTLTIGYSYMATGFSLTFPAPVYVRCTPQTDGSAVMDSIVQTLPSYTNSYIYIYLGTAYSATSMELEMVHPVYYCDDNGIKLWTGAREQDISGKVDKEFISEFNETGRINNDGAIDINSFNSESSSYISVSPSEVGLQSSNGETENYTYVSVSSEAIVLNAEDGSSSSGIMIGTFGTTITNVVTPTNDGDAANKKYVDDSIPTIPSVTASATTGISISNHSTGSVTGVQSTTTTASKATAATAKSVPNVTAAGSGSFTQGAFTGGSFTQGTDSFTANTPTVVDTSKFSGGSFTRGAFSGGSFTSGSFSQGTLPSLTLAIDGTDSSQLNITFSQGTLPTHGADSFTAATHANDSFTAASLQSGFYTAGTAASFTQGTDSFTPATHGADSHTHTPPTIGTAISIPQYTFTDVTVPIKDTSATTVVTSATHSVTDNGHTHGIS